MPLTIEKLAHHRNGVSGEPFDVVLFSQSDDPDMADRRMVAVHFSTPGGGIRTAILDVDLLNQGIIEFAKNSWRGDHFHDEIRRAISAHERCSKHPHICKVCGRQRFHEALQETLAQRK